MAEITVHLDLGDNTSITTLHLHVVDNDERLDTLVAGQTELMAKVSEVTSKTDEVLATTVETAKDVQRLLAAGDTTAAIDALSNVVTSLESARASLAEVDAAVETASPEPTTPTETSESSSSSGVTDGQPTAQPSPVDDFLN